MNFGKRCVLQVEMAAKLMKTHCKTLQEHCQQKDNAFVLLVWRIKSHGEEENSKSQTKNPLTNEKTQQEILNPQCTAATHAHKAISQQPQWTTHQRTTNDEQRKMRPKMVVETWARLANEMNAISSWYRKVCRSTGGAHTARILSKTLEIRKVHRFG